MGSGGRGITAVDCATAFPCLTPFLVYSSSPSHPFSGADDRHLILVVVVRPAFGGTGGGWTLGSSSPHCCQTPPAQLVVCVWFPVLLLTPPPSIPGSGWFLCLGPVSFCAPCMIPNLTQNYLCPQPVPDPPMAARTVTCGFPLAAFPTPGPQPPCPTGPHCPGFPQFDTGDRGQVLTPTILFPLLLAPFPIYTPFYFCPCAPPCLVDLVCLLPHLYLQPLYLTVTAQAKPHPMPWFYLPSWLTATPITNPLPNSPSLPSSLTLWLNWFELIPQLCFPVPQLVDSPNPQVLGSVPSLSFTCALTTVVPFPPSEHTFTYFTVILPVIVVTFVYPRLPRLAGPCSLPLVRWLKHALLEQFVLGTRIFYIFPLPHAFALMPFSLPLHAFLLLYTVFCFGKGQVGQVYCHVPAYIYLPHALFGLVAPCLLQTALPFPSQALTPTLPHHSSAPLPTHCAPFITYPRPWAWRQRQDWTPACTHIHCILNRHDYCLGDFAVVPAPPLEQGDPM